MKAFLIALVLALGLGVYLLPDRAETLVGTTDDDAAKSVADVPASKADATPHFWQRDARGGFANGGRDYCCPSPFPIRSSTWPGMDFPTCSPMATAINRKST